ncbi:MDR family MFS transporter [Microlunatus parietis]|uniref:DHA2 family lincomycin resistance protein-like MFS transporter n=1 Tax=Microlunatus parietis TaxID=682979 RepID=A0A7Y9I9B5_9ACTN|nr:MDR family MFS transporter [Microlunatus parietis]NYE72336.1 DHA2 family lincomycin resistance protein-like MFS transporter [Microlunatus parietis]
MTAPTQPVDATSRSGQPVSHTKIIITLLVAAFVVILNETIMGVALPRLMGELQITPGVGQWLSTVFMLTMAVVIPTTGFLLQRLTTRQVFILAMSLFSAGTLLAGLAPGFTVLLIARVIQASGTAIMMPLLMTTVLGLVPVAKRGVVMGNVSIVISVAPAIGPTLSGLILQFLSWRFMFLLVLPIALIALVYGAVKLVNVGEQSRPKLDFLSILVSVPGFGGIVFGLSQLGEASHGGSIVVAIAALVIGVVSLVIFVWRQNRLYAPGNPLLDLRVFQFPMFRAGVGLLCVAMLALFGTIILLPIYLQNVRGLDPLSTGLLVLPGGVLMGVLAPIVGRLFDRYGPRALATFGATVMVLVMWGLTTVNPTTPIWQLLGLHLTLSLGLAAMFTPAFTTALNPLPVHLHSHGSAVLSTLQQVAGAAGTALLVTIMTIRSQSALGTGSPEVLAQNQGIQLAFGVAALMGIAAIVLAAFLRTTKAEPDEPGEPTVEPEVEPGAAELR